MGREMNREETPGGRGGFVRPPTTDVRPESITLRFANSAVVGQLVDPDHDTVTLGESEDGDDLWQLSIGRGEFNDVMVIDPGVSLHHLLIIRCNDGWYAVDLGSTNGTAVSDPLRRAISPTDAQLGGEGRIRNFRAPIRSGYLIRIGDTLIEVN